MSADEKGVRDLRLPVNGRRFYMTRFTAMADGSIDFTGEMPDWHEGLEGATAQVRDSGYEGTVFEVRAVRRVGRRAFTRDVKPID